MGSGTHEVSAPLWFSSVRAVLCAHAPWQRCSGAVHVLPILLQHLIHSWKWREQDICFVLTWKDTEKRRYWGWFSLIHAAVKGFIPALILLSCCFPFEFWSNTGEDKNMAWISIGISSAPRRSRYVWVGISRGVALSGVLGSKYVAKIGVGML